MLVSVIIPFWNGSSWAERAIESVSSQTCAPAEFFVVNDGSRPEELAWLEALSRRYSFRILNKENGGQSSARNFGVAHSRCDFICFLDQDDYFLPDHIEKLLKAVPAESARFGFAYGSYDLADESGQVFFRNELVNRHPDRHPPARDALSLVADNLCILPSASIIHKAAFEAVGGFDPQFRGFEDDDLFSRMILAGYDAVFLPESVYVWCQHKGSTTWSPTMAQSRFLYYRKVRGMHSVAGSVGSRAVVDALTNRFGRFFYKSAALAADLQSDGHDLEMEFFDAYLSDLAVDNASWQTKVRFGLRRWVLRRTQTFPMSLIWALKRLNRRRIDARRVRDGRQFLGS